MADLRKLMNDINSIFEAEEPKKEENAEDTTNTDSKDTAKYDKRIKEVDNPSAGVFFITPEIFRNLEYKDKLEKLENIAKYPKLKSIVKKGESVYIANVDTADLDKDEIKEYTDLGFVVNGDTARIVIVTPSVAAAKNPQKANRSDMTQTELKKQIKPEGRKQQNRTIDSLANSKAGKYVISYDKAKELPYFDMLKAATIKDAKPGQGNRESATSDSALLRKNPGLFIFNGKVDVTDKKESQDKFEKLGFKLFSDPKTQKTYAKIKIYAPSDEEVDSRSTNIDVDSYISDKTTTGEEYQDLLKQGFKLKGNYWIKSKNIEDLSSEEINELKNNNWEIINTKVPVKAVKTVNLNTLNLENDFASRINRAKNNGFIQTDADTWVRTIYPAGTENLPPKAATYTDSSKSRFLKAGYSEEADGTLAKQEVIKQNDIQRERSKYETSGFKEITKNVFSLTKTPETYPNDFKDKKSISELENLGFRIEFADKPISAIYKIKAKGDSDYLNTHDQHYLNNGYQKIGTNLVKSQSTEGMRPEEIASLKNKGWMLDNTGEAIYHSVPSRSSNKDVVRGSINPGSNISDNTNDNSDISSMFSTDNAAIAAGDKSAEEYIPTFDKEGNPEDYTKGDSKSTTTSVFFKNLSRWRAEFERSGGMINDPSAIDSLITLIQSQDSSLQDKKNAFAELYKRTAALAYSVFAKFARLPAFDDFIQDFGEVLTTAAFEYNKSRGAKFTTFLFNLLKFRQSSALGREYGSTSMGDRKRTAFNDFRKFKNEAEELSNNSDKPWSFTQIADYVIDKMDAKKTSNSNSENNEYSIAMKDKDKNIYDAYLRFEKAAIDASTALSSDYVTNDGYNPLEDESGFKTNDNDSRSAAHTEIKNIIKKVISASDNNELSSISQFTPREKKYLYYAFGYETNSPKSGKDLELAVGVNNDAALSRTKDPAIEKLASAMVELGLTSESAESLKAEFSQLLNTFSKSKTTRNKKYENDKNVKHNDDYVKNERAESKQLDHLADLFSEYPDPYKLFNDESVSAEALAKRATDNTKIQQWIVKNIEDIRAHNKKMDSIKANREKIVIDPADKRTMDAIQNKINDLTKNKEVSDLSRHALGNLINFYRDLFSLKVKYNLITPKAARNKILELRTAAEESIDSNFDFEEIPSMTNFEKHGAVKKIENEIYSTINNREMRNIPAHQLIEIGWLYKNLYQLELDLSNKTPKHINALKEISEKCFEEADKKRKHKND